MIQYIKKKYYTAMWNISEIIGIPLRNPKKVFDGMFGEYGILAYGAYKKHHSTKDMEHIKPKITALEIGSFILIEEQTNFIQNDFIFYRHKPNQQLSLETMKLLGQKVVSNIYVSEGMLYIDCIDIN